MSRLRVITGTLLLVGLATAPAAAQDYRFSIGLNGGGVWSSNFNSGLDAPSTLAVAPTWVAGLSTEWWFGRGRVGLRLGALGTEGALALDGDAEAPQVAGADLNVYMADAALMIRFLRPEQGRGFAPYVAIGGGAVHYNPGGGSFFVVPNTNVQFTQTYRTSAAATLAFGADMPLGLRMEISDFVVIPSPFESTVAEEPLPVHHVSAYAGMHLRLGHLPGHMAAIVMAPPPMPAESRPEPVVERELAVGEPEPVIAPEAEQPVEVLPMEEETPVDDLTTLAPAQEPAYAYSNIVPTNVQPGPIARTNPGRPHMPITTDPATGMQKSGRADVTVLMDGRNRRWTDYPVQVDFERGVVVMYDRGDLSRQILVAPLSRSLVVWLDGPGRSRSTSGGASR